MKQLLPLIFILLPLWSWAQELLFREFELNASLPATETYGVIQDTKGYMWIRTEEGLCRYSKH